MSSRPLAYLLIAVALLLVGCGGDPNSANVTELVVTVHSFGVDVDPNGYTVWLDGDSIGTVAANGTKVFPAVAPGAHMAELRGVARNCGVQTPPLPVMIVEASRTSVTFDVGCVMRTGNLSIQTSTQGSDPDPNGYSLEISTQGVRSLESGGEILLSGLPGGQYALHLGGVASNCAVVGSADVTVTVPLDTTVSVLFQVICQLNAGSLAVTTVTTGFDLDPDDYLVSIDGGSRQPIGNNSTRTFYPIRPGLHTLNISGVAANCAEFGTNARTVDIHFQSTTSVELHLDCARTAGPYRTITFTFVGNNNSVGIYSVRSDGLQRQPLVPGVHPAWSRDGSRLAYTCFLFSYEICAADPDGNNRLQLTSNNLIDSRPSWSPDGAQLVFDVAGPVTPSGTIWLMNADGTGRTQVTSGADDSRPSFSPDGNRILFERLLSGVRQLFTIARDGSDVRQLTSGNESLDAAYSPDGAHILFIRSTATGRRIYEMNADGSALRELPLPIGATHPRYSADNTLLVFTLPMDGGADIFTAKVDGSDLRRVTSNGGANTDPLFKP